MLVIALLPARTFALLRAHLPRQEVRSASSWTELDKLAAVPDTVAIVLDPSIGGQAGFGAAIKVLRRHSNLPVFPYVFPTPENLKAVFRLACHGRVEDAFCCTDFNASHGLQTAIESATHSMLPFAFLSLVEARLGQLPPKVALAVRDLFERPSCCDQVSILARKAGMKARSLHRMLAVAELGTPKKLLTAARVLRGVSYLQSGPMSVAAVSCKLGYSQPRIFHDVISSIFGCSPTSLRKHAEADEILRHLCEWLYKPTGLQRVSRRAAA